MVEGGRPFVQATYFLEGDKLVILYVYDWLSHIQAFIENEHFPLIDSYIGAQVEDIEDVVEMELKRAELKMHAAAVLTPGFAYFYNNLMAGDVGANIELFKAVCLANPSYIKYILPAVGLAESQEVVRELTVLKCVDEARVEKLIAELPSYVQKCTEFSGNWLFRAPRGWETLDQVKSFKKVARPKVGLEILGFYDAHGDSFPNWCDLAEDIFLLAPSSAAVERVFSFLRDKFDKKSFSSLIDYICTSLMLKSNGREIVP